MNDFFRRYSDAEVRDICEELLDADRTGILINGKLRQARKDFMKEKGITGNFDTDCRFVGGEFLRVAAHRWIATVWNK